MRHLTDNQVAEAMELHYGIGLAWKKVARMMNLEFKGLSLLISRAKIRGMRSIIDCEIDNSEWREVSLSKEYLVSDDGRVMSLKNGGRAILLHGYSTGYPFVNLLINGKQKSCTIHRLVAKAFIPNPLNLRTVNHKDGNKENNSVSNLEWMTYKQNNDHAKDLGLHKQRRPVIARPKSGCVCYWFPSMTSTQRYGFYQTGVSKVCLGHKKTHGGYFWSIAI